jgi:hypothetical protein
MRPAPARHQNRADNLVLFDSSIIVPARQIIACRRVLDPVVPLQFVWQFIGRKFEMNYSS